MHEGKPTVSTDFDPEKINLGPGKILKLINEVIKRLPAVAKSHKNVGQNFMCRSIDDVYNAVGTIEAEVGIVNYLHEVIDDKFTWGQKGSTFEAMFVWRFVASEDGSYFDVPMKAVGKDWTNEKAAYMATSMSHKYAVCSTYKIRTGDPDPDTLSPPADNKNSPPADPNRGLVAGGKNTQFVTDKQIKRLFAICKQANWFEADVNDLIAKAPWKLDSKKKLTMKQYDQLCKHIEANPKQEEPQDFNAEDAELADSDFAATPDPFEQ